MVVTRYSKVNSLKIIDPHIHLIDLAKGQYHWLKPQNPPHWPDKHLIEKNVDAGQWIFILNGDLIQ